MSKYIDHRSPEQEQFMSGFPGTLGIDREWLSADFNCISWLDGCGRIKMDFICSLTVVGGFTSDEVKQICNSFPLASGFVRETVRCSMRCLIYDPKEVSGLEFKVVDHQYMPPEENADRPIIVDDGEDGA
jgi:hypothetical protein